MRTSAMRNGIRLVAPLLIVLGVPGRLAAVTAEEIVAKNVEARGGAAALASLKSLRRTGRYVLPGRSLLITLSEVRERPGRIRQEATFQGLTQIQAFDGEKGWQVQPFEGRKEPSMMSEDDAKAFPARGGPRRAFRGREGQGSLAGIPRDRGRGRHARAQAARAAEIGRERDGLDRPRHLDGRSATCRRSRSAGPSSRSKRTTATTRRSGGVYVPMSEESGPRNSPPASRVKSIYDKAEANVAVAAETFAFPAPVANGGSGPMRAARRSFSSRPRVGASAARRPPSTPGRSPASAPGTSARRR